MPGIYSRIQATAKRLIKNYGKPVTLRRMGQGGSYDPSTGAASPVGAPGYFDETRYVTMWDQAGKQVNARYGNNVLQDGSDQTLMESNMKWVYMAADGDPPTKQDLIIMDGCTFTIIDLQILSPGGVDIQWQLVLQA